ncbi:hypothetical protein EG329_006128 [Mollisiaceae sp. DMI_Dod_QoI]|nr:hypothetical protein EG329_006128 [Helotiales sp. DMI_Dod_QoI]
MDLDQVTTKQERQAQAKTSAISALIIIQLPQGDCPTPSGTLDLEEDPSREGGYIEVSDRDDEDTRTGGLWRKTYIGNAIIREPDMPTATNNIANLECTTARTKESFTFDTLSPKTRAPRKTGLEKRLALDGTVTSQDGQWGSLADEGDDDEGGGVYIGNVKSLYEEVAEKYKEVLKLRSDTSGNISKFMEQMIDEDALSQKAPDGEKEKQNDAYIALKARLASL